TKHGLFITFSETEKKQRNSRKTISMFTGRLMCSNSYIYNKKHVMGPEKKRFRWLPDTCTGSGQFIQDLNNYCDRWCDRWIMISTDKTFSHEKEINDNYNNGNSLTFDNEEIEKISSLSFEVVLELIAGYTKIIRIDLEELNENVIPEEEINPVVELAFSYGTAMDNWLEDNNI